MEKKKKLLLSGLLGLIIIILAFPLLNLVIKPTKPALSSLKLEDAHFKNVGSMLMEKCSDCHSTRPEYPWYASLPVASQLIEMDNQMGVAAFDMTEVLFEDKGELSEVDLAKLESVLNLNSMPPLRYSVMHWDQTLDQEDKKDIMEWIRHERKKRFPTNVLGEVIRPIPLTVNADPEKVALGEKLYHDTRLSGDNTVSCASCHDLDKGGTDQLQFSVGIKDAVGGINAPTVYNSSYNVLQFWDGRARDLADQAGGPVTNPIEMGANWEQVTTRLKEDTGYVAAFNELYQGSITPPNIQDAIAAYEETLITPNSAFDKYLRGDKNALSEDAIAGYQTFVSKGCISCHAGIALGGTHFEKMGREKDYFKDRGNVKADDYGRYNATKKEEDRYKFKVPILRNVAVTHPYFHDGQARTLTQAIEQMAEYQLGVSFSSNETKQVEEFLMSLTGEYNGKMLR